MNAQVYQLGSLAALSMDGLVDLVNHAYAGYPGPFSPEDARSYAEFCRVQNIDLARSVLAAGADGTPIGFGLLGIRQERGWCAEFGVVPAWRRQGVGRALLDRLLAEARDAGLHDVRLEVAAANTSAQALYQQAGFRVARVLRNYAALALLAVAAPRPSTRLLVAYVADASPLAALLPALGFRELDPDLEMICAL